MNALKLDNLRSDLIRQEETIIFSLIERAQFSQNLKIYEQGQIPIPGFDGSFSDFLLFETEKIHARVRRYTSPDEHPFSKDLPDPIIPAMDDPERILPTTININDKIHKIYIDAIIAEICVAGDDGNYGSSATADVTCLQSLSKRIHYGKFVAEAKFQASQERYRELVQSRNAEGVLAELTDSEVEDRLFRRVEQKAATFGLDIDQPSATAKYKIQPETIRKIYAAWIIPMTKEVEVDYLFQRIQCNGDGS